MTKKSVRGFTFIELLVVIIVIGILFSIGFPVYTGVLERAKITKDMNNLRQVGLATQTYMNDNDGVLPGSITVSWMSQLHPKYVASWNVFLSPFDNPVSPRTTVEDNTNSTVSYGINPNIVGIASDKISKATVFILFAPAQDSAAKVNFQGTAGTAAPGVTVLGIGGNKATSNPGGDAIGGTQNNRNRINALFADLHAETMEWTTFTNNAATANDPYGELRWKPYTPYP
jgi:prepilin-type N-terminal cleavage/methylation domain-containing protein/prepilin-type processing-associated H-X9-DG protein